MYRDPALIKKHVVKVRLDDDLDRRCEGLANLTGEQKAVVLRQLIIIGLEQFHGMRHLGSLADAAEGAVSALERAS